VPALRGPSVGEEYRVKAYSLLGVCWARRGGWVCWGVGFYTRRVVCYGFVGLGGVALGSLDEMFFLWG